MCHCAFCVHQPSACMGVAEAKFVVSLLEEMKIKVIPHVRTASSAVVCVTHRLGVGRMKHLDIKNLWLQEERKAGRVPESTSSFAPRSSPAASSTHQTTLSTSKQLGALLAAGD